MTDVAGGKWPAAPAGPRLDGDDVHVWLADVGSDGPSRVPVVSALSADERARADRFRFERDRRQYAHSRGILRRVLGAYLDVEPCELRFEAGPKGKPLLARPADCPIAFNVSHSGEMALIAVSRRGEVGVDIEAHRPIPDRDLLAQQFFSQSESARLRSLPETCRTAAFFSCWSRKEAYVKAVGEGLAYPLDAFDVTFAPGDAVWLDVPGDRPAAHRWTLEALPAPPGYAAALVTEGPRRVSCWMWDERNAREYAQETA